MEIDSWDLSAGLNFLNKLLITLHALDFDSAYSYPHSFRMSEDRQTYVNRVFPRNKVYNLSDTVKVRYACGNECYCPVTK